MRHINQIITAISTHIHFQGRTIIFSAPSGSGKTTIVQHLLSKYSNLGFSISACTRAKRPHEQDGIDYYFMTPEEFRSKIDNQEFVEWEQVYAGMYYGTLKSEVDRLWSNERHVLFDVDVKGGVNLKNYFGDKALSIFVKVPSLELLEHRLRKRGTETEEKIQQRVAKAAYELSYEDSFDVTLLNADLSETLVQAEKLIDDFLSK
ncbi:guanylate kinase [Xanthocytophaga agilis]|uniref:Guanylate kinase n=1 Tax=Xanthocytophaga agilis TaxID=3048010 RepID=A0AAE3UHM9_9BACT|nr:guanylate kinase [Xanthocytophaga agilis]MDJ1504496.1 guanylate kinase [Xanthocytophaga agilis]